MRSVFRAFVVGFGGEPVDGYGTCCVSRKLHPLGGGAPVILGWGDLAWGRRNGYLAGL